MAQYRASSLLLKTLTSSHIAFELIETEDRFAAIEAEWRDLYDRAGRPSPFLDFDWLAMCWRLLVADDIQPAIAVVREDDRLVFALPIQHQRYLRLLRRSFALRSALSQTNDALVSPSGDARAWVAAMMEGLSGKLALGLTLPAVPEQSPLSALLRNYAAPRPSLPHVVVEVNAGFSTYLNSLSANARGDIKRKTRRLAEHGDVTLRFATDQTYDADLDWLLAQKRAWAPAKGKKLLRWLSASAYESELRALGRKWMAAKRLALVFIDVGGRPAAGRLILLHGQTMYCYLVTYDTAFARAAPGRMLAFKLIEWAANNGYLLVDFMGGKFSWKDRIKTNTLPINTFELALPWWFVALRSVAQRAGSILLRRPTKEAAAKVRN